MLFSPSVRYHHCQKCFPTWLLIIKSERYDMNAALQWCRSSNITLGKKANKGGFSKCQTHFLNKTVFLVFAINWNVQICRKRHITLLQVKMLPFWFTLTVIISLYLGAFYNGAIREMSGNVRGQELWTLKQHKSNVQHIWVWYFSCRLLL